MAPSKANPKKHTLGPKIFLKVEILQFGVPQSEYKIRAGRLTKKMVRFGNKESCELAVPFATLPDNVRLFEVGRGSIFLRLDSRLSGFVNTGSNFGKVTEFLSPRGALSDLSTVEEPLRVELRLGARGSLKIYGYEVIFKVINETHPRKSGNTVGAGIGFFAMPSSNSVFEPAALWMGLFFATCAIVPVVVWLLFGQIEKKVEMSDLTQEQLLEIIHPTHLRMLPAIYREKFDEQNAGLQVLKWVEDFQARFEAIEHHKRYVSKFDFLSSFPHRDEIADGQNALQKGFSAQLAKLESIRKSPASGRYYQFQLPYPQFESTASGNAYGSVRVRQRRRIDNLKRAYLAMRSVLRTEYTFLKQHYEAENVTMSGFLEVPRTGRFLGAQPSPDFTTEREDFLIADELAGRAEDSKTKHELAAEREADDSSMAAGTISFSADGLVAPDYFAMAPDAGGETNLIRNAMFATQPSMLPPLPKPKPRIDIRAVELVVFNKREQIKACYDSALRRNANTRGSMLMEWSVNPLGMPQKVHVVKSTLSDSSFVDCVKNRIGAWHFPRPSNGSVVVSYPFQFVIGRDASERE